MKTRLLLIVLALAFVQCNNAEKTRISKDQVGVIKKETPFNEVAGLFKKDSVVALPEGEDLKTSVKIYQDGKLVLIVNKLMENDSLDLIEKVQIFSSSYQTEKGLNTDSKFSDLVNQYSINKIEPTFSSALVFIDELNATVALNKADLNIGEFDMRKINQDQIPDMTALKSITIWFD